MNSEFDRYSDSLSLSIGNVDTKQPTSAVVTSPTENISPDTLRNAATTPGNTHKPPPERPPLTYARGDFWKDSKQQHEVGPLSSQLPGDPRTSATDTAGRTQQMYEPTQQQADLDRHTESQESYVRAFANDPAKFNQMWKYWKNNLAQNNQRGNLNRRSFDKTLAYSRMADAYNNRRHWNPGHIGRRTNSSFGSNELQRGYSERWEPINTQEMRQLRANETIDSYVRQQDATRQAAIENYPLELQKQADQYKLQLANYQARTGIDLNRMMQEGLYDMEYKQPWRSYWTNFVTKFARELDIDIKDRVFRNILNMNYPFDQIYAYMQAGVEVPDPLKQTGWEYIQQMANDAETPKERVAMMAIGSAFMSNPMLFGAVQLFAGGLTGDTSWSNDNNLGRDTKFNPNTTGEINLYRKEGYGDIIQ